MQVLFRVLTLFLLMMCGLLARKTRVVKEEGVAGMNTLVLWFAQPALILSSLQTDAEPELVRSLISVFLLTCVIMAVSGAAAYFLFFRRQPQARRGVLSNLSMASNCGFMGYPVITAAMGQGALIYAVIYVAAFQLMCWTLGTVLYVGKKGLNAKALLNPSLLAVALGLVLFFTGWRLPVFINDGLDMLGSVTTPVAMFVIGARLIGLKWEHLADKSLLAACALRLVAFPLCVLLLCRAANLPEMVTGSLFLCTAMPCAALTAMQAELYRADVLLASRGVAVSTVLSMATIPLLLLL